MYFICLSPIGQWLYATLYSNLKITPLYYYCYLYNYIHYIGDEVKLQPLKSCYL